jgi:DNA-binding response OmpR family regulator
MKKYKVFVLENTSELRDLLVTCLERRDFEAYSFSHAEDVLTSLFESGLAYPDFPDLLVVDLELEHRRMQGLELVAELADRDISSEILVISGNLPAADLSEAIRIGAAAGIPKPFDLVELLNITERLAEAGKKRKWYRFLRVPGPHEMDPDRRVRPVFLSYSTHDKKFATGLRRNLEARHIDVWYARTELDVGDLWQDRIEEAIDKATIFLALMSDQYIASKACIAELMRFQRRLQSNEEPKPVLMPVLSGLSEGRRKDMLLSRIFATHQYIDISTRFNDGLTVLIAKIQSILTQGVMAVPSKEARRAMAALPEPFPPERSA